MARITHVKKARQRYETVPVLDEDGNPRRTLVKGRTAKGGREVTMAVTVADKSKPLPNLRCDFPGCDIDGGEILVGTSYKHITPKSGPYGGTQRNRHAQHPNWNVWEYSYSVSARAAQVQNDMHNEIDAFEFTATEDFDSLKESLADMADDFVSERQDALDNMPEQLQDGSQAAEYLDAAESWKDEIDGVDAPDEAYEECEECDGTGEGKETCPDCDGTGEVYAEHDGTPNQCSGCEGAGTVEDTCEHCNGGKTDVLNEDWIEEAKDTLREAVDGLEI